MTNFSSSEGAEINFLVSPRTAEEMIRAMEKAMEKREAIVLVDSDMKICGSEGERDGDAADLGFMDRKRIDMGEGREWRGRRRDGGEMNL